MATTVKNVFFKLMHKCNMPGNANNFFEDIQTTSRDWVRSHKPQTRSTYYAWIR